MKIATCSNCYKDIKHKGSVLLHPMTHEVVCQRCQPLIVASLWSVGYTPSPEEPTELVDMPNELYLACCGTNESFQERMENFDRIVNEHLK